MNPNARFAVTLFLLALAPIARGQTGSVQVDPATGLSFLEDPNQGGTAPELKLTGMYWGRLVDVFDRPAGSGVLRRRFRSFLIGNDIQSNGVDWELRRDPITQAESLTILHRPGSPQYLAALQALEANLTPIQDKDLNALPPFTMVARNSAIGLRFDDLLDAATIAPENVRTLVGHPPQVPFTLRVLPDASHGAVVGGAFETTRVILDLTVSPLEAQSSNLPVNLIGLPGATTTAAPNVVVRIPTQLSPPFAQFTLLTNLAGNALAFNGNGSNDPSSRTLDVLRAFRSGGKAGVTGDPFNGFLSDTTPPEVVGTQPIQVTAVHQRQVSGRDGASVDLQFGTTACAVPPRVRDVIELPAHVLIVIRAGSAPVGGAVQNVRVRVLVGNLATLAPSAGRYRTVWDSSSGALPECFVGFSPLPLSPPNAGVSVNADVVVSFSEPLDPNSIDPQSSFTLAYGTNPSGTNPLYARVVGDALASLGATDARFVPTLPLRNHGAPGQPPESYTVQLAGGPNGLADLAGNALFDPLPPVSFTIDPNEPAIDSASVSLTFESADEDGNGAPEVRGQFLYDLPRGVIRPRPVLRFSATVDPTLANSTVWAMVPLPTPVQTPLSPLGSKLMSLWRCWDMGMTLLDEANHNLDVEGLWWEPSSGALAGDDFAQFQMVLSHATYVPDEDINTGLLPRFPSSGLVNTFNQNFYDPVNDPPQVVHPKAAGYALDPLDVATSASGRAIAPWPMNRGVPPSQFARWTWRDTAQQAVGGPSGGGADIRRHLSVGGAGLANFYPTGMVPTIGLPMLTEFRTYPDPQASGLNGLQIAIAINTSARPYFRTFSTGGVLSNGTTLVVDPDTEFTGSGGVNPATGSATAPQDNAFYFGQADFVVRVSRAHTMWFDTLGAGAQALAAVVEPPAGRQPAGTQVVAAYRGASALTSTASAPWHDASNLDPYGDSYTSSQHGKLGGNVNDAFAVTEFPTPGDDRWVPSTGSLTGARYLQVRLSFIGDPETLLAPEVSSLGLTWLR